MSEQHQRQAQAHRFRDYFSLQLHFAESIAVKMPCPLAWSVLRHTNFYRRFGLGDPRQARTSTAWQTYIGRLNTLNNHLDRLQWTQEFYRQSPPEPRPPRERQFGCFDLELREHGQVVRVHFQNHEQDGLSPLHPTKIERRQRELKMIFSDVRQKYPEANEVWGKSWLYNSASYCSLFPTTYIASKQPAAETTRFQGSSCWGQLIDHQGNIKPDLADQFVLNLAELKVDQLWKVFPLSTWVLVAPIQDFFEFYL